ncbi:MAG: NAD(P)/FAD-dependent oxidoreductase [Adhaeribacter sp.]
MGGGLAGLVSAICLAQKGLAVTLYEKKAYPFHRVCGEYISNEVLPFLESLGLQVEELAPARISRFLLSSPAGNTLTLPLDLGGFGVSRYCLDAWLADKARQAGVEIRENCPVQTVSFTGEGFLLSLADGRQQQAGLVIGAYGKRSHLDRQLQRPFFRQPSPYLGVKYHLKGDFPVDQIALHNFAQGYAGISAIEGGKYCFCYLTTRANLKRAGSIPALEAGVLARNPLLASILQESKVLWPQPEVINEVSFAAKSCVEDHVLLAGDAAGMIAPLCGNGMAMAIHGAKILSGHVLAWQQGQLSRQQLEARYQLSWQAAFGRRLQAGRLIQGLFGQPRLTEWVVGTLKHMPAAVRFLLKQTHGKPF